MEFLALQDGYPTIEDFETLQNDALYQQLCQFSDEFVEKNPQAFGYYKTKWGDNPVRHWSRQWEYPFIFQRVNAFLDAKSGEALSLFDAGSGLTFISHYFCGLHENLKVECGDSDQQTCADAQGLNPPGSERARYSVQDIKKTTFADEQFDLVYCISVLEHCGNPTEIIHEFARVLKPGGRLVLTIDISFDGNKDIAPHLAAKMIQLLETKFTPDADYISLLKQFHPQKYLTTNYIKQKYPERTPWQPPYFFSLSVFGMCFVKK